MLVQFKLWNLLIASGPSESCLSGAVGGAASPYATQIYSGTPTHMGPMTSKQGNSCFIYYNDSTK